jgi:hypothetical protein
MHQVKSPLGVALGCMLSSCCIAPGHRPSLPRCALTLLCRVQCPAVVAAHVRAKRQASASHHMSVASTMEFIKSVPSMLEGPSGTCQPRSMCANTGCKLGQDQHNASAAGPLHVDAYASATPLLVVATHYQAPCVHANSH